MAIVRKHANSISPDLDILRTEMFSYTSNSSPKHTKIKSAKMVNEKRFKTLINLINDSSTQNHSSKSSEHKAKVEHYIRGFKTNNFFTIEDKRPQFYKTDQVYLEGKKKIKAEMKRRREQQHPTQVVLSDPLKETQKREFGKIDLHINKYSGIQGVSSMLTIGDFGSFETKSFEPEFERNGSFSKFESVASSPKN